MRRALDNSGLTFEDCYHEDRGDGLLLLPDPRASLDAMVTSVVDDLNGEVRRQNQVAAPEARIQLRVAVHSGPVHFDRYGVTSRDMIHAFRLLDAPAFKRRVRESGARLGAIISSRLYDDVVRPDVGRADPADYQRLRVEIKETRTWAWLRLLGLPDQGPMRTNPEVVPEDVLTLAQRLLELPFTASRGRRTALVDALPDDLADRIRRETEPLMDAYCIVRPCVETAAGAAALLNALRRLSPGPGSLGRLDRDLADLPWLTGPRCHI
jgi:hypothetical protein